MKEILSDDTKNETFSVDSRVTLFVIEQLYLHFACLKPVKVAHDIEYHWQNVFSIARDTWGEIYESLTLKRMACEFKLSAVFIFKALETPFDGIRIRALLLSFRLGFREERLYSKSKLSFELKQELLLK